MGDKAKITPKELKILRAVRDQNMANGETVQAKSVNDLIKRSDKVKE